MCGGGGGSSQPSQQTVTQVTIPPEIMPYAKKLLGTAEDLVYNQPYQSYEGQRFAGFNPLQMKAFGQIEGQQTAAQLAKATDLATIAGNTASQSVYNPAAAENYYTSPAFQGMDTTYRQVTAPGAYTPDQVAAQQVEAERIAANYAYDPERVREQRLKEYRMGPAALVGAQQFGLGSAAQYMSPFMQDVVERQKREAVQDYARGIPAIQAAGARAGARGGTREALIESEARRNLANQLGGIQATGLQSAYQQAMQQYNVDQAQRMQAELANQAAIQDVARQNLQAAMGIQQLGAGQNLQAQLANQAAFQRSAEYGSGQKFQAAMTNQEKALQAALANQQANLQASLANQQANMRAYEFGAGQGMQAQQLNQAAQLQQQQQALSQSAAANQFAQQNAQQRAQYGLAGQQLAESSRQFGANYGLSNIQQQLAAAGMLGNLGQTQFGQQQAINQAQMAAGSQAQQLEQARLQAAYEDFLNRQRYPYQQLGFMSDLIRGTPTAGNVQSFYGAQASPYGSLAGIAGMYMAGQSR